MFVMNVTKDLLFFRLKNKKLLFTIMFHDYFVVLSLINLTIESGVADKKIQCLFGNFFFPNES